ncbi:MAG: hypothetical protein CL878_15835 [Dehalococcoidia bacterium]|nr:hypothetical protein [Dehalococcoidia bacterium]
MSERSASADSSFAGGGDQDPGDLWTTRTVVFIGIIFAAGVAASPARALLAAYVDGFLRQPPRLTAAVTAIQMACSAVFALVGGIIADRAGRRATLLIGLALAISGAFLLVAQTPWHLLALAVVAGTSAGFVSTGGQSYLLAVSPTGRLGAATAAYFLGRTASQALGAYAAGLAAALAGFRTVGLSSSGLLLLVAVAALRWLPHEPEVRRKPAPPQGRARSWSIVGYWPLLRRADVLALGTVRFFPTVAWGTASLMFPLLVYRLTQSEATVGLYGTVSLIAATAAQLATGRAIDRVGARVLVFPLCVAILLCAILAVVLSSATVGLFVAGTLWSMTAWGLSTTMPALMRQLGQGVDDGRVVALMHTLWSMAMLSGMLAAGELVEVTPQAPFIFASGCLVLTCIGAVWFGRLMTAPRAASADSSGATPSS